VVNRRDEASGTDAGGSHRQVDHSRRTPAQACHGPEYLAHSPSATSCCGAQRSRCAGCCGFCWHANVAKPAQRSLARLLLVLMLAVSHARARVSFHMFYAAEVAYSRLRDGALRHERNSSHALPSLDVVASDFERR
jgi:hypothetical protein